jgi:hypothetical protein
MVAIWLAILSPVVAALVLMVHGLDSFALWNLTPVAIAAAAALFIRFVRRADSRIFSAFSFATLACVTLLHLAWRFDWGGTATGSSTSGLIFIFAPIYAMVVGVAASGIAWVWARWRRRLGRTTRRDRKQSAT